MSGAGLCVHTGTWTPADATVIGCDGVIAKAAPVVPPPPPPPAPPPAPPLKVPAPVPTAEKVTYDTDAFFDFDKATLKPEGRQKLTELASRLNGVDLEVVVATGHTDAIGTKEYNQKLSERRARAVKDFLVSQNVPADKVFVQGKGELQPVASNKTRDGRRQNRRVEVEVVGTRKR